MVSAKSTCLPSPAPARQSIRYVAKQPILDARESVFGYELLFRDGPENLWSAINSDRASLSTMDYSLAFGTNSLTGGKAAFVNCTRELLTGGFVTLLPPDSTVLEILEDVEPDPEVLRACRSLRSLCYRFALDDFVEARLGSPFLDYVTYVKVDIRANSRHDLVNIEQRLTRRGLLLIAEKVETREEFDFLRDHCYHFFQGYFFCRPILLEARDIPTAQHNQLRLLQAVSDSTLDLKQLDEIIRPDVSLCYRLLRYLNSAAFGLYPIRSVMHALILLGEREIRKWIALVTAAMLGQNKVPELARLAIVRGKFCESYAPPEKADQYFLTGLFSLLEPMLERPMSQLVAELPISNESRIALLGGDNELANLLEICEMCERGEFEELRKKEKVPETISQRFQRATMWADIVLGTAL